MDAAGTTPDVVEEWSGWNLVPELIEEAEGIVGLTVVARNTGLPLPDGTIVLFECDWPVLDDGLCAIEVPTVDGQASVDLTPRSEAAVWVQFNLSGVSDNVGRIRIPGSPDGVLKDPPA